MVDKNKNVRIFYMTDLQAYAIELYLQDLNTLQAIHLTNNRRYQHD